MTTPRRPDRETWHALEQAHLLVDSLRGAADPADAPCAALDAQTVRQYLAGTLDTAAAQRVVEHLAACDACRHAMSEQLPAHTPPVSPETTTLARGQLDVLFATLQQHSVSSPVDTPEPDRGREEQHGQ